MNTPQTSPKMTVLNFSGGKQSSLLLWMVIKGDIPRPKNFIVLNADPGMENSRTYDYVNMMFEECKKAGIKAVKCKGRSLYDDLLALKSNGNTRIDNPPYWTKNPDTGKRGRLTQKCTGKYKVQPMDRELRKQLFIEHNISLDTTRLGDKIVEKWIGFSAEEWHRCSESRQKYTYFRYPLIELGMDNAKIAGYYLKHNLPVPERSVCNACFANGLVHLKQMYEQRPKDWAQAVAIDDSIRDLSQIGVKEPCYVSGTLVPLRDLPAQNFLEGEKDDYEECSSMDCFR